jgi:CheY-like chemotaxis protein
MISDGHILVVDDDPDLRESLRMLLELRGFGVLTAANGTQALASMRKSPPRLVLLDLMMPIMTGAELLELVRQDDGLARIPIIIVSAWPEEASRLRGARAFMQKPVDLAELLKLVKDT